jgi:5-methylcytosine-specific restriction protein B
MTLKDIDNQFDKSSLTYWFVGASFSGEDDQFKRFVSQGIWENGYENELIDKVNSMKVGDKIAIKSSYVRKKGCHLIAKGILFR